MTVRRRIQPIGLGLFILVMIAGQPAKTQAPPTAGTVDLRQAREWADSGRAAEAAQALESLSRNNPGTELDAQAQLQLAWTLGSRLNDLARARQIYSQVASRFPGSRFEYMAAINTLDARLFADGVPFEEYIRGVDELVVRAGGPRLGEVQSGRRLSIRPVTQLDAASQRLVLGGLYLTAAGRMNSRPEGQSTTQLIKESINVYTFARDALASSIGEQATLDLQLTVLDLNGQLAATANSTQDLTPPTIAKTRPKSSTGPRPHLVAKVSDGDIFQSQVDPGSIQMLIDGADVSGDVQTFTKTSRKARAGRKFQVTKIRYRPANSLTSGTHAVMVRVDDRAGNRATETWSFNVESRKKDDLDDERGDERCDLEPDEGDD